MKRPRVPSQVSESLHQRLSAYALAASAAGVGVLALAHPAEARVVYTKAHHVIRAGDIYYLDLNHDGVVDFLFQNVFESNSVTSVKDWWLAVNPSGHNGARGHAQFGSFASALQYGKRIVGDSPSEGTGKDQSG